jgi:hypothetical protein
MSNVLGSVVSSLLGPQKSSGPEGAGDLFGQLLQLATGPQGSQAGSGAPAPGSAGTSAQPLLPSVRVGTDTGGEVREQPLSQIATTDRSGNGYYGREDITQVSSIKDTASTIVDHVGKNPEVKVALLGEMHGEQADKLYFETIKQAKAAGQNPIAVIETPTSPELDKLIDDFYAGKMSKDEFIEKGAKSMFDDYKKAQETMGPLPPELAKNEVGLDYFKQRLADDIFKYHDMGVKVEFFDPGRLVEGANRDEQMAEKFEQIIRDNPGSKPYAQIGMLHAQENSSIPMKDGIFEGVNAWKGVKIADSDYERPAAERLKESLGDEAVLSIGLDDYTEFGKEAGANWEGRAYSSVAHGNLAGVDYAKEDRVSHVKPDTFDYVVPVYDESKIENPHLRYFREPAGES